MVYIKFVKTKDSNIVNAVNQEVESIHLDKLDAVITNLEARLANVPKKKNYPVGATDEVKKLVDFWNDYMDDPSAASIEVELANKKKLRARIKSKLGV